ncbi:multidrug resistance-associated protein 5 [Tanacetum coccineum]
MPTSSIGQHVDNVEQNDASDSDLDDDDYNIYEYDSESEESDTASVDHLSDGEEEIYDTRTRQPDPKPKKMFDDNFLSKIYNGLPRDEFVEKDVSADKDVTDKDNIGDKFPIHDPTVKWKLMRPVLGEKYESPDQLKRALAFYALANGYKLYYEVNNPRRLLAKCCRDAKDRKCPFSVENKDNWVWFMELLISDLGLPSGQGLTIISDQHKGIIEAAKQVMPMAEHRQCARHIYANFRKKYTGVLYRNLFWQAAKATYPTMFEKVMKEIQCINKDAYKHLMDRHPESWSRAYFTTDKACDAVENMGISYVSNGPNRRMVQLTGIPCVTWYSSNIHPTQRPENYCVSKELGEDLTAELRNLVMQVVEWGGKVSAKGWESFSTPSTPDSASIVVSSRGVAMQRLRTGVFIRSPEKVGSSYADTGSSSMNGLRTVNGKVVSSRGRGDGSKSRMYPHHMDSMGIPRPAWPEGITPQDCIIEAATQSEIAISQSPPVEIPRTISTNCKNNNHYKEQTNANNQSKGDQCNNSVAKKIRKIAQILV